MTSCTKLDLNCVWVCLCPIETSCSVYTLYVNLESCELASAHDCACLQVNLFGTKPRMADRHERFGRGLTGTRKRHTVKNVMDCASSGLGCLLWLPRSTMRMVSTPMQRMQWRYLRVNNRVVSDPIRCGTYRRITRRGYWLHDCTTVRAWRWKIVCHTPSASFIRLILHAWVSD